MILLDKPYVSAFLQRTARDMGIPVLNGFHDGELISITDLKTVNENEFLKIAQTI